LTAYDLACHHTLDFATQTHWKYVSRITTSLQKKKHYLKKKTQSQF